MDVALESGTEKGYATMTRERHERRKKSAARARAGRLAGRVSLRGGLSNKNYHCEKLTRGEGPPLFVSESQAKSHADEGIGEAHSCPSTQNSKTTKTHCRGELVWVDSQRSSLLWG